MTRRLSLQTPLVFEPFIPLSVRRLAFLLIAVPGPVFASFAMSSFSGAELVFILIFIALLSIGLCLYSLDGIEGKLTVDAEGIEWRSPLKKKRLLWNDDLQFQTIEYVNAGGATRVHELRSENGMITFGENLRNFQYLILIINSTINRGADEVVTLPPAPVDTFKRKTIECFALVSGLSFVCATVIGVLLFEDATVVSDPAVHGSLEQGFLVKAVLMAAALALGIYMMVAAFLEARRAE
ncbi:MAG: hypothetical protein KC777_18840 [Cyanobacteria bacterium HKST-UBA02]|nr:hypothetical protein [Cyanobacteria bacterium HKST-UBA02]